MNDSHVATPTLRQVVLDCEDARTLAEFYRQLLGLHYRAGDELPTDGTPDARGQDWLVLCQADGSRRVHQCKTVSGRDANDSAGSGD